MNIIIVLLSGLLLFIVDKYVRYLSKKRKINSIIKNIIPIVRNEIKVKPVSIKKSYKPRSMTNREMVLYANKPNLQWWIDNFGEYVLDEVTTIIY